MALITGLMIKSRYLKSEASLLILPAAVILSCFNFLCKLCNKEEWNDCFSISVNCFSNWSSTFPTAVEADTCFIIPFKKPAVIKKFSMNNAEKKVSQLLSPDKTKSVKTAQTASGKI